MMPVISNYAGFWALLGIPVLLLIHFLQQRSRRVVTSTLFLLERLAPESKGGRKLDRLRMSRSLLLQLLAVLVATWILIGPRWMLDESAQVVVAVLDDAVSMQAFRSDVNRAVEDKFSECQKRAARTEWVVMTSNPRQPTLYRGIDRSAAEAAVAAWQPSSGTHDYGPALRLARSIAGGENGVVWFITDRRGKASPGQNTIGVGRPMNNVGFAGVRIVREEDGTQTWRALVQNHSGTPQVREWWVAKHPEGTRSPAQRVELSAGGLMELSGRFPEGDGSCVLVLSPDGFPSDDRLPLVRPVPKRLSISLETNDLARADYFRKLGQGMEGVQFVGRDIGALRIADLTEFGTAAKGAAIYVARMPAGAAGADSKPAQMAPIISERNPLVADLNWQGFVGAGAASLKPEAGSEVLLWQAGEPLAWLSPGPAISAQLVLNVDWERSNAARLPSTMLLFRRFMERVRDAQPGAYTANFDSGSSVKVGMRESDGEPVDLTITSVGDGSRVEKRTVLPAELAVLRAPNEAAFFEVKRHDRKQVVSGAAQFADSRQGAFADAESFENYGDPAADRAAIMRNSRPDPWVNIWLLGLGGLLLWSFWPGRRRSYAELEKANTAGRRVRA